MIEYISYKQEDIPICVDFNALAEIEKEGLSLDSENNLEAMQRIFWHSLKSGYFHENGSLKDFKITEDAANFILGTCFMEFQKLMTLFLAQVNQETKPVKPKAKMKKAG